MAVSFLGIHIQLYSFICPLSAEPSPSQGGGIFNTLFENYTLVHFVHFICILLIETYTCHRFLLLLWSRNGSYFMIRDKDHHISLLTQNCFLIIYAFFVLVSLYLQFSFCSISVSIVDKLYE